MKETLKPGDVFTLAGRNLINPDPRARPGAVCRVCGCTDDNACNPPCAWFDPTLCTTCALAAEALREWSNATVRPSLAALLRESDMAKLAYDLNRDRELRARYITEHAAQIGVRIQDGAGQWRDLRLSNLPVAEALREGFRLLLRAEEPHRVLKPDEVRT